MAIDCTVIPTVLKGHSVCVSVEVMVFHSYIVAAGFHARVDAIEVMKQVIAEVTAASLDEEGCHIYHWSQGADDPTLFLLYMEPTFSPSS